MASLSCRIEMRRLVSAPPCEQSMNALDSIPSRIERATTNVAECAATHPKQTSHLPRATAGGCRVEYLLQTLTHSPISEQLVATCSGVPRGVKSREKKSEKNSKKMKFFKKKKNEKKDRNFAPEIDFCPQNREKKIDF